MDVFRQRLEDEYAAQVIITAPTVPYKSVYAHLAFRNVYPDVHSYLPRRGENYQQSDRFS